MAAVVADHLVDLDDDVLGDFGVNGLAIDHLGEVDALLVWLSDRYLAEYFRECRQLLRNFITN